MAPGISLPTLPIARALAARGHDVRYSGQQQLREPVLAAGFQLIDSAGATLADPAARGPLVPVNRLAEAAVIRNSFAGRIARERAARLVVIAAEWRPDVLVRDEVDFGAAVAAERLGIAHASVIVLAAGAMISSALLAEPLDRLRAEHGLGPDPELAMLHRHLTLVPVPPSFRDPLDPLPPTAHHIRPAVLESEPASGPELARTLDWLAARADRPAIYFTLGTVFHQESGDLFPRVLAAIADLNVNVVVTVGREIDPAELGSLPCTVHVERFLPQRTLLQRCDLVISHAGSGSVIGALAFGVPRCCCRWVPTSRSMPIDATCSGWLANSTRRPRAATTSGARSWRCSAPRATVPQRSASNRRSGICRALIRPPILSNGWPWHIRSPGDPCPVVGRFVSGIEQGAPSVTGSRKSGSRRAPGVRRCVRPASPTLAPIMVASRRGPEGRWPTRSLDKSPTRGDSGIRFVAMTSETFTELTFTEFADGAVASLCAEYPEQATFLGDHSHDHELSDPSLAAAHRRRAELTTLVEQLDGPAAEQLGTADSVDREILRTAACSELLDLSELDEASWNPMLHNPGQAIYALLSRDFAPLPQRLSSLAGRLRSVPDYLQAARTRLTDQSSVHVETAIGQLDGTLALIETAVPEALAEAGGELDLSEELGRAAAAVREHQDWLRSQLAGARRSPRLGEELFARKLALTLATPWQPKTLLEQAYRDLERVEAELAELVGRSGGVAAVDRSVIAAEFDRLAEDCPTSDTILGLCGDALAETTAFVRDHDLMTLLDDPVDIIEMPEIDRGVAVAYCVAVGALETAPLSTQFAVSPTPRDWSADRVRSFYREYNNHMLHNLTVHEAMPGHVEQLSHSHRYRGSNQVRGAFGSGSFIEGWAVYAEELMAAQGYRADVSAEAAAAVRMQQLKMQLRSLLNTILDVSFHTGDLDERQAMQLMTVRGYQEDGEAAGKWRRVQLSSTQLSTYYVGYLEVSRLATDLRAAQPSWSLRQVHDAVLSFGSPPVRYLRQLLGLPPAT